MIILLFYLVYVFGQYDLVLFIYCVIPFMINSEFKILVDQNLGLSMDTHLSWIILWKKTTLKRNNHF